MSKRKEGGRKKGRRKKAGREKMKKRWKGRMADIRRRKAERERKMMWKFGRKVEDGGTHKLMIGGGRGAGVGCRVKLVAT